MVALVSLNVDTVLATGDPLLDGGILGLDLVVEGDVARLVAATGMQGGVVSWTIDGAGTPALAATRAFGASFVPVQPDLIARVEINGTAHLVIGRQADGRLLGMVQEPDGALGNIRILHGMGVVGEAAGALASVALPGQGIAHYFSAPSGLAAIWGDSARGFAGSLPAGPAFPGLPSVLSVAEIGAARFLIAGFAEAGGIACYRISATTGGLTLAGRTGADFGLGLERPAAIETLSLGERTYAVVAGQGTHSLSVIEILADGRLKAVDHVLDSLETRFADTTALAVGVAGGRAYVAAGGSDDGVSLFELLPGGRLLHLDTIVTAGAGIENIADLALRAREGRIDLFAIGATGAGIAKLSAPVGAGVARNGTAEADTMAGGAGDDLLAGGAGNDRLYGGEGADVLLDGPGLDRLEGGAGADTYVLARDGELDRIHGFEPGIDRLDFSAFWLFHDPAQLEIVTTSWGATVTFRDEVIEIHGQGAGIGLSGAEIRAAVLRGPSRPPLVVSDAPLADPEPVETTRVGDAERDILDGTAAKDRLFGGAGNDILLGNGGDDELYGGEGDDLLRGHGGNDLLYGGPGNDRFYAGPGDDSVFGGGGADVARLGAGNDRFEAGEGTLGVLVYGSGGGDQIRGGAGDDRLYGGIGYDTIWGGAGSDRLWGDENDDLIFGGAGNDLIRGGTGVDSIHGEDGDDLIWGDEGGDLIWGGAGNDLIRAGPGNDIITGEDGDDIVFGDAGADTVLLGVGHDQFFDDDEPGFPGADRVYGGPGNDVFHFRAGNNLGFGGTGADTMQGGADPDTMFGEAGNDVLSGAGGNDRMLGGDGNDILSGGAGIDLLLGDAGDDVLEGGRDTDYLTGGAGADLFRFRAGDGIDRIRDFEIGIDRIEIGGAGADTRFEDLSFVVLSQGLWVDYGRGAILLEGLSGGVTAADFVFV